MKNLIIFFASIIFQLSAISVIATNGELFYVKAYFVHNGQSQSQSFTSNGNLTIDEGTGDQLSFRIYRTMAGTPDYKYWGTCGSIGWLEDIYSSSTSKLLDPESNYTWYFGSYYLGVDDDWIEININEEADDKPDLVVSEPDPDFNPPFEVGDNVDWDITVSNIGAGATTSSAYVKYYLGTSSNDFSDQIGSDSFGLLDAGESSSEHDSYTFSENDIGTRYLNVWVDPGNGIIEENENNNTNSYGPFTVNSVPPQISVSPASYDFGQVHIGQHEDFNFTVTNTGYGNLSGSSSVSSPFSIIAGQNYSNLEHNENHTVTVRFQPTSAQSYSKTVSFSGGGGTTATVSGSGSIPHGDFNINVFNVGGSPMEGAKCNLYQGTTYSGFTSFTNASGVASFTDVPVGNNYHVKVYYEGNNFYNNEEYFGRTPDFEIVAGTNTVDDFYRHMPFGSADDNILFR